MRVWSSKWESGPKKRRGDERKGEKRTKEKGKRGGDKGNHNQDDLFFDQIR